MATTPGGSDPNMSEGPLRPGLTPKAVWFPFVKPAFYAMQLRNVSRRRMPEVKASPEINVRQKRTVLAGGHGVFKLFNRGR